jgi:hypothetical protein
MSRFVLLTGSVRTESAPGSSAVRLSGAVMSYSPEQLSPTVLNDTVLHVGVSLHSRYELATCASLPFTCYDSLTDTFAPSLS